MGFVRISLCGLGFLRCDILFVHNPRQNSLCWLTASMVSPSGCSAREKRLDSHHPDTTPSFLCSVSCRAIENKTFKLGMKQTLSSSLGVSSMRVSRHPNRKTESCYPKESTGVLYPWPSPKDCQNQSNLVNRSVSNLQYNAWCNVLKPNLYYYIYSKKFICWLISGIVHSEGVLHHGKLAEARRFFGSDFPCC